MARKKTLQPKLTLEERLDDIVNILKELEKENESARAQLHRASNYAAADHEPDPNTVHGLITCALWDLRQQTPLLKRIREHLPNIFRIKVYED